MSAPVANSESRVQYSRRPILQLRRSLGVRERRLDAVGADARAPDRVHSERGCRAASRRACGNRGSTVSGGAGTFGLIVSITCAPSGAVQNGPGQAGRGR